MNIPIKTDKEIQIMREGGHILADLIKEVKDKVYVGVATMELEKLFLKRCQELNVKPACKNYSMPGFPPFPSGLCISINDESVHCFPVEGKVVNDGDLLTIDTVIEYKNMFLDSAVTIGVGSVSQKNQNLMDTVEKALHESIKVIKPGVKTGLISSTMYEIISKAGYSVLQEYAGHGIGNKMHEPPEIPCYGDPEDGFEIKPGMVFAIEPLVCENNNLLDHNNYWETKTLDGGMFVQFEHTVLVTDNSYEILTK